MGLQIQKFQVRLTRMGNDTDHDHKLNIVCAARKPRKTSTPQIES